MIALDFGLRREDFRLEVALTSKAPALALFGPSGSGKTSLLNAVAGLLRPQRGHIVIAGRTLFDAATGVNLPPSRRRLGVVFQDLRLFPHMSVRDNLLFGTQLRTRRDEMAGFDDVVALLGLESMLRRRPLSLSGGEARRVAIGRALLANPLALLLDEPLAGLHRSAREEVLIHLRRLKHDLSAPVLLVSHQADEVAALADEVAIIDGGRIQNVVKHAEFCRGHGMSEGDRTGTV